MWCGRMLLYGAYIYVNCLFMRTKKNSHKKKQPRIVYIFIFTINTPKKKKESLKDDEIYTFFVYRDLFFYQNAFFIS